MIEGVGRWVGRGGSNFRRVASALELQAALDEINEHARKRLSLGTITSPQGARLLIGIGGPQSVLQFNQGDDPPYLITLGDPDAEGVEKFFFEGQETEVERRHLIPADDARRAALAFFETGSKPDGVRWEEV